MLPASVILTNRLINSSEAKDNSKVMQQHWHMWENVGIILNWPVRAGRLHSRFITTQPCLNVFLCPAIRKMVSSSVYVSSPWNELVVCLSTYVCLRFHLRNDFDFVCVCVWLPPTLAASVRLFKHTCSIIWLCIPWHCALALDLQTSFPDCDNRFLEPSVGSSIMVICWGHWF